MAMAQVDAAAEPLASIHDVIDAMDEAYARLAKALEMAGTLPDEGPGGGGGWGMRRLLSHIIGVLPGGERGRGAHRTDPPARRLLDPRVADRAAGGVQGGAASGLPGQPALRGRA